MLTSAPPPRHTSGTFSPMPLMSICAAHPGWCPTPTNCTKPHASPRVKNLLQKHQSRVRNPLRKHQSKSSLSPEVDAIISQIDLLHIKPHRSPRKPIRATLSSSTCRLAIPMNSKQTQYRNRLDIPSMVATIELLAPGNMYSPHCQDFPLALRTIAPKREVPGSAQPQGGIASGTTPAPLLAHPLP